MKTLIVGHDKYFHNELMKNLDVRFVISHELDSDILWDDFQNHSFKYSIPECKQRERLVAYLHRYFKNFAILNSRRNAVISDFQSEVLSGMYLYGYGAYSIFHDNDIQLVIFQNLPHEGFDYIFYIIAKFLDIKIVMTNQSRFPDKFWITNDLESFGDFDLAPTLFDYKQLNYQLPSEWFDVPLNLKKQKYSVVNLVFDIFTNIKKLPVFLLKYHHTKNFLKSSTKLKRKNNKILSFVYVPLQMQPELTTASLGGIENIYSDQLQMIEQLSLLLPKNINLLIRENPKQNYLERDKLFFKRLGEIANVIIENRIPSQTLIKDSVGVVTVTGTAGFEALYFKKPVLVFGNAWYKTLPGVTIFNELFRYEDWAFEKGEEAILDDQLSTLLTKAGTGIVDSDFYALVDNFSPELNAQKIVDSLIKYLYEKY